MTYNSECKHFREIIWCRLSITSTCWKDGKKGSGRHDMKEHHMNISQNWFWWGRIQLTNIDCSGNWSLIGECVWHLLSHLSSHNYIVIADHWLTVGSWVVDDVLTAQPGLPSICSCISALIVWCHHDSSILWPWILAFITSETLLLWGCQQHGVHQWLCYETVSSFK